MTVENETIVDAGTAAPDAAAIETSNDEAMGAIFDTLTAEPSNDDVAPKADAKLRNADGKFAAAEKSAADESSLEGEKGADAVAPDSTVAGSASAPAHLPQAIKADWDKIPEASRAAIVAHQTEMDRKFSEVGRQLAQVKPVADRLTQAVNQFPEFAGRTPEQLAQGALELAAIQSRLERSPETAVETILEIAKAYNVSTALATRFGGQPVAGNANTEALQQQIKQLEGRLAQAQISPDHIQEQVSKVLELRSVETEVNAFMSSKPYFADVQNDMPFFITKAKQANPNATPKEALEAAYDMAVNADPTVRQKMQADGADKVTTLAVDTKRTDAAKKAASINPKPTVNGKAREMTEDELLGSIFEKAMAS